MVLAHVPAPGDMSTHFPLLHSHGWAHELADGSVPLSSLPQAARHGHPAGEVSKCPTPQ